MPDNFRRMLAHVTGGRRYCFVIMSYGEGYPFFKRIREIVAEETGVECIRADDVPGAGEDLRAKIHAAIDGAAFVIGDVSRLSPNIYYEVGYSVARNKPILMVIQPDVEIPTDLAGVELIEYTDTRDGWQSFEVKLRERLGPYKDSNVSLLSAMLVPRNPRPSYIVANPRQPVSKPRVTSKSHPPERRTYGDNLGIVGILGAFASVYGEHVTPELLTASRTPKDMAEWDANFYLIGSFKSTRQTSIFLDAVQDGRHPRWKFDRYSSDEYGEDYIVRLSGEIEVDGEKFATSCEDVPVVMEDYGVIVRGPNPRHPDRMITILAGPHSLGTGAACLAATKSERVREIRERLAGSVDLEDRNRTIWVLVKGEAADDLHNDLERVEIVDAGVYEDR